MNIHVMIDFKNRINFHMWKDLLFLQCYIKIDNNEKLNYHFYSQFMKSILEISKEMYI